MSASLLVHDAILRGAIEGNSGYVFTTAGDRIGDIPPAEYEANNPR